MKPPHIFQSQTSNAQQNTSGNDSHLSLYHIYDASIDVQNHDLVQYGDTSKGRASKVRFLPLFNFNWM